MSETEERPDDKKRKVHEVNVDEGGRSYHRRPAETPRDYMGEHWRQVLPETYQALENEIEASRKRLSALRESSSTSIAEAEDAIEQLREFIDKRSTR